MSRFAFTPKLFGLGLWMKKTEFFSLSRMSRTFRPFTRPYLKKYWVAICLLIVTIVLSLLPPFLLKVIVDSGIKEHNVRALNMVVIYLILALLVTGFLRGVMDYIHEWVSAWMIYDIRHVLFNKIQAQSLEFFFSNKTGDILTRLRGDVGAVYGIMVNTFLSGLAEVIQIAGIAAFMLYLNYKLAIIAFLFTPLLYFLLSVTGRRIRELSLILRDKDASLLEFFHEVLSNIHIVKLFSREEYMSNSHAQLSKGVIASSLRRLRYKFLSIFLIGTLTGLAPIIFIWYGGYQVISGALTFGTFIALYLYAGRLYAPIQSLAVRGVEIYNGLASAQRIAEYLNLQESTVESETTVQPDEVRSEIVFSNVKFKYPGANHEAITGLSFTVLPGQKVALVGPSGAGKTTIINLLCRLYDIQHGEIVVDGHNLKQWKLKALRNSIGVVSQEVFLFNDSILENIRFARPDATDEEVMAAARTAHLHDLVMNLRDGYQTVIGARGLKLSGGQRQRVALARVILKDAKIWVLDEFTAALDSQTEALIYENIAPFMVGKTAIIIAHRLSTVMASDRIIVLENGAIQEMGGHRELYHLGGLYQKLFEAQMQPMADGISAKLELAAAETVSSGIPR
jgi:subfamily B ATP-binding cassette protein MsbA